MILTLEERQTGQRTLNETRSTHAEFSSLNLLDAAWLGSHMIVSRLQSYEALESIQNRVPKVGRCWLLKRLLYIGSGWAGWSERNLILLFDEQ